MNMTDKILIEGFAAIIEALGMIAENQTRYPSSQWGQMWFDQAAGIFRNKIEDIDANIKAENYKKLVANHGVPELKK